MPSTSKNEEKSSSSGRKRGSNAQPLLLDTRSLPDAPLVWVSRPDGSLAKMLKCRHCPYVTSRRAEVQDHEIMHIDRPSQEPLISCDDCSFKCTRRNTMTAHVNIHTGSLGTVHCLVDQTRTDLQQLNDLSMLLGLARQPVLGAEPELRDLRLVHCCGKCPARFLCEKELRIHLRYHSTELAYMCPWCSYAARQPAHLFAHQKAHSTEYQERTKYLLTLYGHSQRYPPPTTACVDASSQEFDESSISVAWVVVQVSESTAYSKPASSSYTAASSSPRNNSQVFTCAKCPARYFKLDALEYHMTLHGSNNRYKCSECDYSSKTAQNLIKHQAVHRRHNENSDTASPNSSLASAPDPQLGEHSRGNPNFIYPGSLRNGRMKEKRYKCNKCPSAFEKREQYRVHLSLHGAKQRYRCDTCDYSVKYYANYVQHLKKHQANAEAQASQKRVEDEAASVNSDDETMMISCRSGKTIGSGTTITPVTTISVSTVNAVAGSSGVTSVSASTSNSLQVSNQDKQMLILMQKKGMLSPSHESDIEIIRCQNCPFSTTDKDAMDAHKRRHGIERMTPSCPHCDYIPRRDENVADHVKLHFKRLHKPESYLIIELLTLTMRKIPVNKKDGKAQNTELLFKEYADGKFFPQTDRNSVSFNFQSSHNNNIKEKVIVDPNTGETKQRVLV